MRFYRQAARLLICAALLAGCQHPAPRMAPLPELAALSIDAMRNVGAAGCGMSLWQPDTDPWQDGISFFHGMDEGMAFLVTTDSVRGLPFVSGEGEQFYGQWERQTFGGEQLGLVVIIGARERRGREVMAVAATLRVSAHGTTREVELVGNAGC